MNRVKQAIRDPLREGLDQLKKMRNYEARLGYLLIGAPKLRLCRRLLR
jgi:hypothetical protein